MNPREFFFYKVYDLVKGGDDIVLVTPDLAAPSLDKFRIDFPDHYISVGVAEQSLISTACGLALGGKKVIAWGLNPFVVTRALDQIRNTVSLMDIPIIISGLHTGLSSAISGATHVVITDLSVIRTCSKISTFNPSDIYICNDIFDEVLRFKRPYYLRFDKDITYEIERMHYCFRDGFSVVLEGSNEVVLTTGYHVNICRQAIEQSQTNKALIDVFRIPCNKERLIEELKSYKQVITVEEHVLQGGFGSFILEVVADFGLCIPIKRIGIDIEKGYPDFFGNRDFFEHHFGLDRDSLIHSFGSNNLA